MKTYTLTEEEMAYLKSNLKTALKLILPVKEKVDIDHALSMAYDLVMLTAGALDMKSLGNNETN